MEQTDAAWLAGFLEGEAYFGVITLAERQHHGGRYGPYTQLRLQVRQVDRDMVDAIATMTGMGIVRGPLAQPKPEWQPIWEWSLRPKADVESLLSEVIPYMKSQRRIDAANRMLAVARQGRKPDRRTQNVYNA